MSITTIILDLDGTLIDANTLHRQSFEWAVSQVSDFKMTLELEDELEGISTLNKVIHINDIYNKELPSDEVYKLKQMYTENKAMSLMDLAKKLGIDVDELKDKVEKFKGKEKKFLFQRCWSPFYKSI